MKVETFETPQDAAKSLAKEVAELIRSRAAEGRNVVLGLATGATPLPFYAELVRMHKEEGLSFANVISFNLDEYSGLDRDHPESYWYFMHTNLFNHIDMKPENINLPSGTVKGDEIAAHCAAYEQKIKDCGGIDLQILALAAPGTSASTNLAPTTPRSPARCTWTISLAPTRLPRSAALRTFRPRPSPWAWPPSWAPVKWP